MSAEISARMFLSKAIYKGVTFRSSSITGICQISTSFFCNVPITLYKSLSRDIFNLYKMFHILLLLLVSQGQ
jgi:hypothetical protein